MRAGRLTSTLVITRRGETIDVDGTPADAWSPVLTTRAEIVTDETRTVLGEGGERNETEIVARIHHRDGIALGDRVTLDGREFALVEIKTVAPRELELRCTGRLP